MARIQLAPGIRYLLQAQVYQICQVLPDEHLLVENQTAGGQCIVAQAEVRHLWAAGLLQFEVRGPNAHHPPDHPIATAYAFTDFQQLPERSRAEAWRRYQCLLPLLQLPAPQRTRAAIAAHAATLQPESSERSPLRRPRSRLGQAASRGSLERWLRAFEASGYDLRALVPAADRQGGTGHCRLDAAVEGIITDVLATCAQTPAYRTGRDVYLQIVHQLAEQNRTRPPDAQLSLPGQATIYRRIHAAGAPSILRPRASRAQQQAEQAVFPGPSPQRILERVELDHTMLDLFLVDDEDRLPIGRPTVTTALDVYSGLPLGCFVGFEPASYRAVMNCLLHAILPKVDTVQLYGTVHPWLAYGLPEQLAVDGARELTGRDLIDACGQLGIALTEGPGGMPWFRGSIERHFRTNNTGLIHTLPGTTFSNLLERGDYDPARHACLSLRAFWQILHIFLVDIYAQQWHKGLGGIPAHRWQASVQAGALPALPCRAEEVRILLLRTEERTLQRYGIEFETLIYQSADLARLRSQLPKAERTVRIKYDPGDLGAIYVSDPTGHMGWLRVPAVYQAYTAGLSLWKHRIIRRAVLQQQQTVDIVALAAAKQRIQDLVAREFRLTRTSRTRKTAARFLDIGTSPAPSTGLPAVAVSTGHPPPVSTDEPRPSDPTSAPVAVTLDSCPTPRSEHAATGSGDGAQVNEEDTPIDTTGFSSDLGLPQPLSYATRSHR